MIKLSLQSACLTTVLFTSYFCQAADAGNEMPNDWPQYHRTANAWRYSPLDQINTKNVHRLKVAWVHQPGDITNGLQATPIVIDGIAYYTGPYNNAFALNAATGETIWHHQTEMDPVVYELFLTGQSRGVTVGHGKVFLGTSDGRFIALDKKTGKQIWSRQIVEPRKCNCSFTSPPQLAGDILFGGTMGGDFAGAGKIYGVNANTGESVWTFDIIRDDPESWPADAAKYGGGNAWLPGTYDKKSDTIYIGTGNAAPDFDGEVRPGDNKYTATLLALEPNTGKMKWHYQEIPHDIWDYDATFELLRLEKQGMEFLVHPSKSGFVFVYDKKGGNPRHVWRMTENITIAEGYDLEKGDFIGRKNHTRGVVSIFCPGPVGIRNWNHGAYNPKTGLWYNNTMEICGNVKPAYVDPKLLGLTQPYFGSDMFNLIAPPNMEASAHLEARDPISGELGWSVDHEGTPGLGSILTTAGYLVFNTDTKGLMRAHDARTGKQLWQINLGSGSRGGIVSYAVDGRQYILATSGVSGWAYGTIAAVFPKLRNIPGGGILIAFTLDNN